MGVLCFNVDAYFHEGLDVALTEEIRKLSTKSSAVLLTEVQNLAGEITQLSNALTGAFVFLPGYDQRLCDQVPSPLDLSTTNVIPSPLSN